MQRTHLSIETLLVNFKFALSSLFVLALCSNSLSQGFRDYERAKDLDEKVKVAYSLGSYYVTKDLDSQKILGESLLQHSKHLDDNRAKNYAYQILGAYYIRASNVELGLKYLRESRNYFAETEEFNMVTELSNLIGNGYQYMGKYEKAISWYRESLLYGYSSSDEKTRFISKANLAVAYAEIGEFKMAEELAVEYREWAYEIKSKTAIANAYATIGKICLKEEYNEAAMGNFELSMTFAKKSSSISQMAHGNTNIGILKFLKGQRESSLTHFKKALYLHKKVKTLNSILEAYFNLGGLYFELEDLDLAEKNYLQGLDLAINSNKYNFQADFYNALIELYRSKKIDTDSLKKARDIAVKKHQDFIAKPTEIDLLLDADLRKERPAGLILTNRTKQFYESLVVPVFLFFLVVILGQLWMKRLI